ARVLFVEQTAKAGRKALRSAGHHACATGGRRTGLAVLGLGGRAILPSGPWAGLGAQQDGSKNRSCRDRITDCCGDACSSCDCSDCCCEPCDGGCCDCCDCCDCCCCDC